MLMVADLPGVGWRILDEREREKRVYLQLHELDYNHTKCEIQNTG